MEMVEKVVCEELKRIAARNRAFMRSLTHTSTAAIRKAGWCCSCKFPVGDCECDDLEREELDFEAP
jgi:hypothetical protein